MVDEDVQRLGEPAANPQTVGDLEARLCLRENVAVVLEDRQLLLAETLRLGPLVAGLQDIGDATFNYCAPVWFADSQARILRLRVGCCGTAHVSKRQPQCA